MPPNKTENVIVCRAMLGIDATIITIIPIARAPTPIQPSPDIFLIVLIFDIYFPYLTTNLLTCKYLCWWYNRGI